MAKICAVTGKRPSTGHKVSHSNRKTKRRYLPNMLKKRIFNPETGKYERMNISAHGLRIVKKKMK